MSLEKRPTTSFRGWISGLAVTLTTIVAYLAFWHLAPLTTFAIGCIALVGLVIAGWVYGRESKPNPQSEIKLPPRRDLDG